jgi:hypothetical protein
LVTSKIAESAKIFAVTTDTTANMNSFGIRMEAHDIVHIYCTDHVLQQLNCKLCCEKPLDTAFGAAFADSVKKARDIVSFLNKSTQATEKRKNTERALEPGCTPKGVKTDVVTRWW